MNRKTLSCIFTLLLAAPALADFQIDRSVMSEKYWMRAIIYWNLSDGYAAFAKPSDFSGGENLYYGGLCRFDMTPKPAYQVVRDLFGKEWRTDFERDVGGRFSFRGFHGTCEMEASAGGRTVKREFCINPNHPNSLKFTI